MRQQYPSIYNDVLGPVMRGPSSSHTAAYVRVGQVVRQLLPCEPVEAVMEFRPESSIAATHHSQCADAGFAAGLIGMDTAAERLLESLEIAKERGVKIAFVNGNIESDHPNGVKVTAKDCEGNVVIVEGQSIGGGMIEITGVNGYPVMMSGGFYETLFFEHRSWECGDVNAAAQGECDATVGAAACVTSGHGESEAAAAVYTAAGAQRDDLSPCEHFNADWGNIIRVLNDHRIPHTIESCQKNGSRFVNVKTEAPIPQEFLEEIRRKSGAAAAAAMVPVLPVRSQLEPEVPYITAEEILRASRYPEGDCRCVNLDTADVDGSADRETTDAYGHANQAVADAGEAQKMERPLWELGLHYECVRSGLTEAEAYERMREIVRIMDDCIKEGLAGTTYEDRMLHQQSHRPNRALAVGMMVGGTLTADIISYITAVMETKSAMGRIVAAPTAGSCGCLPGTVFAVAKELKADEDAIIRAMFAGSMVGVLIAEHATFAAEVGGCQAECGSGSGITAAAVTELLGGTASMALDAASMALQNVFGMVCDPVAGRVEVPCLGKNIMTGTNAVMAANMAVAGFDKVIPLDETIHAMHETGRMLPPELRCTGRGGLSVVPSAKAIEQTLK